MRYLFGDCELNTQTCELRRAGVPIPLTPKAYAVLDYLISHRDRLVSKEELLEQVWPDTYVDDSAVKRNIMAIRRAIGDGSGASQPIKTQRGQGYRFIAAVQMHDTQMDILALSDASSERPAQAAIVHGDTLDLKPCTTCQHENLTTARFCTSCGQALDLTCGHCGQAVVPPAAFCPACGQTLTTAVSPHFAQPSPQTLTAPDAPVGERKLITALCGTVANAPLHVTGVELDVQHSLMQTVYALALDEAQRYGGTMQYTTGEGFLIVFGVPMAQEDHARRAVLTALGLQRRVRQAEPAICLPSGEALILRMALHTGLVVVGQLQGHAAERPHQTAHDIATVVGDVVTLASAMVRQTPPDAILASDATLRLLQHEVRTTALPPLSIEASSTTVPVQQILEFRPQHMPHRAVDSRSYSPFVGREAEMAMLRTRWAQVQYGQGHVVSVVGEPGMGKSRLLYEFRQELASETVSVLPCSGQSHGSNTPYLPIIDLVHTIFNLTDTDTPETIRAKVRAGCQDAHLNADALEPLIGSLLGLPVTGEALAGLSADVLKTRTFEALHQIFLRRGQQHPCVIEVENAHWIDATSEAYLSALIERLAGTPLLLLVTFRPGYRPTWLDKSYVTQIALQPLRPLHSRQVMQAVLGSGSLTETMGPQLLAKAEGNPLFLEELARTVAEQGGAPPALAVPDTIHAVLAERIDRLAPAEKQILQAAAVVGQQVSVSLLHTLCGRSHSDLQRLLMQLQAGEFLYETQLVPESVYTFKHALTHEVTYANLLREQRRRLHARIVEALETQGNTVHLDDQIEVLAHHALGAEQWDKVCDYFRQAGAKAMTRPAYREAAACFEQALHSLSHLPGSHQVSEQAVDLRLSLHVALFRMGEVARSLALLRDAESIAESLDDAGRLGWIVSYLSTHCFMAGDAENALACSQRAQALAMACADTALQVDVHLHLGQVYHARGEYAAAIAALEPNIAFLNEAWQQDQVDLATLPGPHSVPWLMMCLAEMGAFAQGYSYAAEALRVAAIGERPYEQVAVYGSVGVLALRQGDLSRAIPELERAVALCQTAGIPHLLPMGMAHLGAAYTLSGRLPEAISLLQQAIAQGAAMGIRVCQALAHIYLGRAYLQIGQLHDAREHVLTALDLCEAHHEQGHQAWALHLLGDLTARDQADAIEAAEGVYRQAITQAETRGMRPLVAHCHFSLANLYRQYGQPTQAEAERSTALALYRSMNMAFWLSRVHPVLA